MPLPTSYLGPHGVAGPKGGVRRLAAVVRQSWPPVGTTSGQVAPVALVTNGFKTAVAGPNTATVIYGRTAALGTPFDGTLASGIVDYPRNVVITVTHGAAVVALSGVISGIDKYGRNLTEAWSVTAGTVSKTFTGAKAFARVDTVTVIAATDASTDTVIIGTGNVLGLDTKCSVGAVGAAVKELTDGGIVVTGTLVAASSAAAADPIGTYLPATVPNAAHTYDLWFVSDDPAST